MNLNEKEECPAHSNAINYIVYILLVMVGVGSILLNHTDLLLFNIVVITIGLTGLIEEYFFKSSEPRDERTKWIGYKSGFFSHHMTNISIIIFSFLVAVDYVNDITIVLLSLLLINSLSFIASLTINSLKN
ncbi:hypothetical protein [Salinicoccus roseus]|uniref:hypothetical protein n=1 Tax=Salinicoccus roseus TaxID=45670 RepID=UPI000F513780|nr:hypothetical protein [Salinicoccus roseus]RPE52903.1 hypothetical protein EDC33_1680 [Salinicoccus roseus]GGA72460.1 hypothetical protein GCM10007176_15750 [Salinicoccus roseus]